MTSLPARFGDAPASAALEPRLGLVETPRTLDPVVVADAFD